MKLRENNQSDEEYTCYYFVTSEHCYVLLFTVKFEPFILYYLTLIGLPGAISV